jgi:hypothetical protein
LWGGLLVAVNGFGAWQGGWPWSVGMREVCSLPAFWLRQVLQLAVGGYDAAGDRRPGHRSNRAASRCGAPFPSRSEQAIDGLSQCRRRHRRDPPQRRLAHNGQQPISSAHPYRGVCRIDLGADRGQAKGVLLYIRHCTS